MLDRQAQGEEGAEPLLEAPLELTCEWGWCRERFHVVQRALLVVEVTQRLEDERISSC